VTKQNEQWTQADLSRRNVLKTILFTPPFLMFSKGGLFANQKPMPLFAPRVVPPGQKVRTAVIGAYSRGAQVIDQFKRFGEQIEFKAFADVAFLKHNASIRGGPGVPCYRDYREMFEQMHDQIDAVLIHTPDHSHFPQVVHAMLLGKHVYVEKPLAQNVLECRILEKLSKSCKVVVQMGNQGHHTAGLANGSRRDCSKMSARSMRGWPTAVAGTAGRTPHTPNRFRRSGMTGISG
jgi:hypothetical protein